MTAPDGTATPDQGGQQGQWAPPASQQELDRIIGDRLARQKASFADYDDLKLKASKFDEAEQRNLTEAQRLSARVEAAEGQLTPLQQENTKLRVAISKKLDPTLVDRLRGTTKEEIEADADELLKLIQPVPPIIPSYDGGGRTSAPAGGSMNDVIRAAAGYGSRTQ